MVAGVSNNVTVFDCPGASEGRGFTDARLSHEAGGTLTTSGPVGAPPVLTTVNGTMVCPPTSMEVLNWGGDMTSLGVEGLTVTATGRLAMTPSALVI